MSSITEKLIFDSLSDIIDESEGKPITHFIRNILIKDGVVFFTLEYSALTRGANADAKEILRKRCVEKLLKIEGVADAKITLTSMESAQGAERPLGKKMQIPGVKKVILVASGKGGVGKSTVACNLAIALSEMGKKVAVVDADIYGPSIPIMFGITQKPEVSDNLMIPIKQHGIKLMSMGFLVDKDKAAVWRGPMVTKALFQLIRMTNWVYDHDEIDIMIVDTPPGTGDVHLSLAENYPIDSAILVSTPQAVALADVKKAYDMFNKLSIPVLGIVENMSYFEDPTSGYITYVFGRGAVLKFANSVGIRVLETIPLSSVLTEFADCGMQNRSKMLSSEAFTAFKNLARLL